MELSNKSARELYEDLKARPPRGNAMIVPRAIPRNKKQRIIRRDQTAHRPMRRRRASGMIQIYRSSTIAAANFQTFQ